MGRFTNLRFDQRMLAIAASLALGVTSAALAWTGTSSDRVYFCVVYPNQDLQCRDKQNRPFQMTRHHWQQWQADGQPTPIIANVKVGNPQGLVPATNPYKTAWAFSAFLGFAVAGWMLRHLQHEEVQLAPLEAIAQQQQEAIADMSARADVLDAYREVAIKQAELEADVELVRHEHLVRLGQAELLGETEIEIARLEAEEIKFDAQTAGLTDEQKHEYIEFLKKAETPYLTGTQTLDGINNPADKVAAAKEDTRNQQDPPPKLSDELEFDITRLNPSDPTKGKNVSIVAGQGVGKTTLALYISGNVLQSPDIQVYDLDDDKKTWGNLPVWGTGDDASQIAGAMQADKALFEQRTQQRIDGERFPFAVRILDETPATMQQIPKPFAEWAFMMTSRARKRGLIAILLTQFRDPELNGIKPDQWRTSFTTFYLGFKQVSHALNYLIKPKDLADRLRAAIDQCDRPCLVAFEDGWYWYDVPDLKQWAKDFLAKTHNQINPTSDTQLGLKPDLPENHLPPVTPETMGNRDRQRLEFLLNLPDEVPAEPDQGDLSDRQKAILQYAAEKDDWITPSELQANVRQCRSIASKEIIADFEVLSANGFGISDKSGKTTKWRYTL
jgi:hypothetical protein